MKKIILDLCGGTGSWSKPYVEAGYDVYVATLPFSDVTNWRNDPDIVIPVTSGRREVYGILAAPPCTMFSRARQTAKSPRDLVGAMRVVRACMDIIWTAHPHFWAMENPMGILRQFMGKPVMNFNPSDFGDYYRKSTDLWGYFNEPKKKPVRIDPLTNELMKYNNRQMPELPEDYVAPKEEKKYAARRAMTPQGFAKAFYKANK